MAKKIVKCEIDKKSAEHIASQILKGLGEFPAEASSTVLNGIAIALMVLAADIAERTTEKGMVEKMILGWFPVCDQDLRMQFGKYINLEGD